MPDTNTPHDDALGTAIPEVDWPLVSGLLARFGPPPTQSWVWFTIPVVSNTPRVTHLFGYNPITDKGEYTPVRGGMPPDCPPYPWTGWGLLYPDRASTPFGPWIDIPAQSAFHGTVSCFYQRVDIVPGAVYAEYSVGVLGGAPTRTQSVFRLDYTATAAESRAVEQARKWIAKWALAGPGRKSESAEEAWGRLLDAGRRACTRLEISPEKLTHAILAFELDRDAPPGGGGRVSDVLGRAGGRHMRDLKRTLENEHREKLKKLQVDAGDAC